MAQETTLELLRQLATSYPEALIASQQRDVPRIEYHLQLVREALNGKDLCSASVCDVGGGIGLFTPGCRKIGIGRVVLVDDFNDNINRQTGDSPLKVHTAEGVDVVCRDVTTDGVSGMGGPWDVVTCFDSMEHWHHHPRRVLREMVAELKQGGTLIVSVPNCVSLRKRITVPLGYGKWSALKDWYETDVFRGHVREPDVDDLRRIASDLHLKNASIAGRNWAGYCSHHSWIRGITQLIDQPLRLLPSLCSSLYLVGTKP